MAAQRRPARAPATAIKPRLNGVHTVQLCHCSLAGTCKSDRAYLSVPEPSRRHLLKCEWHPPVHRKKEPKRDIHRPRAHTHTHIRRHGHAHDCFIFYPPPPSSTRNAPDFQASHGRRAPRLQRTHRKTQRRWALHLIHRAPHSTRRSLRAPYRAHTSARGQANRVELKCHRRRCSYQNSF